MRSCSRCLMPDNFPGISIDADGLCSLCDVAPSIEEIARQKRLQKEEMVAVIRTTKTASDYDCIVAFSGGKDSTFTLQYLVDDHRLKCLAILIDNGFISPSAFENCRNVTNALGVDHQIFSPNPKALIAMFRTSVTSEMVHSPASIKRGSAICNTCINVVNSHMVRTAVEKNIPMIAGGYLGGQVPKGSASLELSLQRLKMSREGSIARYRNAFGESGAQYLGIRSELFERYAYPTLKVINPLLTMGVSENDILASIEKIGWKKPGDTGAHSSNCRLNDLGIAIHQKKHGFNPYILEICEQVREGVMSQAKARERLASVPSSGALNALAGRIGIPDNEF